MRLLFLMICVSLLPQQARGLEIQAPSIPSEYRQQMPENTDSLEDGLHELIQKAVEAIKPDLREASRISMGILAAVLLVTILQTVSGPGQSIAETAGIVTISVMLLTNTGIMIRLAAETAHEISEYGKLLLPVMTTALAAQGGITASGSLYAGTAFFTALLQSVMDSFLVPGVYLYLSVCIGSAATGENLLKHLGDLLKQMISWCLKMLLMIFTTYLSLTHVINGTTDAAALKAAKVSMSSFIPVVGGILSDASEAVLVSAGMMKNAAGIYGILAVLALFLHPFLQIGVHYLVLKVTAGICGVFGTGRMTGILDSFCSAMALLLAMTGAGCIMVLISTVCFMKGAN